MGVSFFAADGFFAAGLAEDFVDFTADLFATGAFARARCLDDAATDFFDAEFDVFLGMANPWDYLVTIRQLTAAAKQNLGHL